MKKIAFCIFSISLLLTACSGESKKQPEANVSVETLEPDNDGGFILPQPITLANALKNAGLVYKVGKSNLLANKNNYSLKIDQLLNLGVYSTDLAYCAINNKSQEAREYLIAIQSLGEKVGMKAVFSDKDIISKFEKSIGNAEELESLIYDLQEKSDVFIEDNDMKYIAAIQFTGAWAEGMYLGIDDAQSKENIGVALVDQMNLLQNIIKALEVNPSKNDPRLKEISVLVKNIKNKYNSFESVKTANANVNFKAPQLTKSEFDALAVEITKLRNNIINAK